MPWPTIHHDIEYMSSQMILEVSVNAAHLPLLSKRFSASSPLTLLLELHQRWCGDTIDSGRAGGEAVGGTW